MAYSLLFVCIGNTCRSPIAVALAKRRWPEFRIESAGTNVTATEAASDAIYTMRHRYEVDISNHRTRPISAVDLDAFDQIVALDKSAKILLMGEYRITRSRIRELYIDDPSGDELVAYDKCAQEVSKALGKLVF